MVFDMALGRLSTQMELLTLASFIMAGTIDELADPVSRILLSLECRGKEQVSASK